MKRKLPLIAVLLCVFNLQSQIVNIPDTTLKNTLINSLCVDTTGNGSYDSDVDTNNDNEIQISEALAVLRLDISKKGIQSLEGIEEFTELKSLNCSQNNLNSIDLSKNTRLVNLFTNDNNLSEIDVTNNLELVIFNCWGNNLTKLDVSLNKQLSILYCSSNKLEALDLSQNPKMMALFCFFNELKSLNLKNGQNTTFGTVMATVNPDLRCIQVDDHKMATENTNWLKDSDATYSENCSTLSTDEFQQTSRIRIFPNPVKDYFNIAPINSSDILEIKLYNIHGKLILSRHLSNTTSINLTTFPSGTYFLKTKIENQWIVKKVIKL